MARERVVHAKGSGAYGVLKVTKDITKYTKATKVGKETPCLWRFSTVAGERGAADAERDVRGFAMKYYTDEGNWDLVGNNTPVFFVRDPYKFPDFIRTQKRDPRSNLRNPTAMWDFWSLSPESLHQVTILFSDRGLSKSYRHMNGYGSHTYCFINKNNERFWVKFHLKTVQGIHCLTDEEAAQIVGGDRESHQRDLLDSTERGDYPQWRMFVQIMPEKDQDRTPYNPFDLTKVWPHGDYPLMEVGLVTLNRNPENYFAEIEQASFSPANMVPGISHSPDKMLQFRIFSYADAHPLSARCQLREPAGEPGPLSGAFLPPRRLDAVRRQRRWRGQLRAQRVQRAGGRPRFKEPPLPVSGDTDRYDHREGNEDYKQPGDLFRLMTADQKKQLSGNFAAAMKTVPKQIQLRQIRHFYLADPAYGERVANRQGIKLSEVEKAVS